MSNKVIGIALIVGVVGVIFAFIGTSLLTVDEAITDEDIAVSDIAATPDIDIESESEAADEAEAANNTQNEGWAVEYSPEVLALAQSNHDITVLFFNASWCPTCRAAVSDFEANATQIPEDVQIIDADFDTATELKRTYNITSQHTFVALDSEGNEVGRWVGGDYDDLVGQVAAIQAN